MIKKTCDNCIYCAHGRYNVMTCERHDVTVSVKEYCKDYLVKPLILGSNEKYLEKRLCTGIKKIGGQAYKFVSPNQRGVPDRIILMPYGKIYFAELKSTGRKPTLLQEMCLHTLDEWGFEAFVLDSVEKVDEFLNKVGEDFSSNKYQQIISFKGTQKFEVK